LDEKSWVKVGVEYNDGRAAISAVLTVPNSDWSTGPFEGDPSEFWVRVTLVEGVLRLQISMDGETWPMVRLCPFPRAQIYRVGPMCCSPKRAGLEVEFSQWSLGSPFNRDLHDLT
ncbi:MAG TPA: DUF1349 domain-containing protein, partial [Dongiaceae bacterium]|nr:DUF1349 domain-containing protein [Dongiaceae bacterium]